MARNPFVPDYQSLAIAAMARTPPRPVTPWLVAELHFSPMQWHRSPVASVFSYLQTWCLIRANIQLDSAQN